MSSIFIPYINQAELDHKFFYSYKYNGIDRYATVSSGLYESLEIEKQSAYALIFQQLLIYDQVYITFKDFYYLTDYIDHGFLRELLSSGAIRLVDTQMFKFSIVIEEDRQMILMDKENRLDREILKKHKNLKGTLKTKIYSNTIKIENDADFIKKICDSGNNDLKNENIQSELNLNMNREHYLKNQYIYNRIYYLNYFMSIIENLSIPNLYQDKVLHQIYKTKAETMGRDIEGGFEEILRLENVPSIEELILNNQLSVSDFQKIREGKSCKQFREWIASNPKANNPDKKDILSAYHRACIEEGKLESAVDSIVYKSLMFAAGFIPVVGPLITLADTFKNPVIKSWKPNFFINQLRNQE